MIVLVVSHGVVLLVVEPQASRVLGSAVVLLGLDEVFALIDDNLVGLGGVGLVLKFELVGGEGLDGEVGGQDGSIFGHDVGSLCDSSGGDVVKVGFVCLSH